MVLAVTCKEQVEVQGVRIKSHGYDGVALEWYNSGWVQQIHQKERLRTKVRFVS